MSRKETTTAIQVNTGIRISDIPGARIVKTVAMKFAEAMIEAVEALKVTPEYLLVDGNRFRPRHLTIPYRCEVKGDGRFRNIAAASILAKTHRDEIMETLDGEFPEYHWAKNKGYPTKQHREAIWTHGITEYHRKSFNAAKPLTLFDQ